MHRDGGQPLDAMVHTKTMKHFHHHAVTAYVDQAEGNIYFILGKNGIFGDSETTG